MFAERFHMDGDLLARPHPHADLPGWWLLTPNDRQSG